MKNVVSMEKIKPKNIPLEKDRGRYASKSLSKMKCF